MYPKNKSEYEKLFSFVLLLAAIFLQAQAAPMADDGKTFLENFYQKGAECFFDGGFVKKNLTKKALAYLHDNYDYDDDTGEGPSR